MHVSSLASYLSGALRGALCACLAFGGTGTAAPESATWFLGSIIRIVQGEPPEYTDSPGTVYFGPNPAVDPAYRGGFWSNDVLELLGEMQAIEATDALFPAAISDEEQKSEEEVTAGPFERGSPPAAGDPASGPSFPWEAEGPGGGSNSAPGVVTTQTGNRLSAHPIVSWPARGELDVDLTLYHNSRNEGIYSFGYGWRSSFDVTIYQSPNLIPGTNLRSAIVQWPNGRYVPYRQFSQYSTTYVSPAGVFHKLKRTGTGWELTLKGVHTKYLFNLNGYLTAIRDRNANQITVTRGGANFAITSVTDPTGRALNFTLGSNGRVSGVTDPTGRLWSFTYSAAKDLTQIAYPILNEQYDVRYFGYDAQHNVTSETDLRGKAWTCGYDGSQRLSWFKNPFLNQTTYSYGSSYTTWTLPLSQQYRHNYSSGLLASEVDPAGFSVSYLYDASRNTVQVTDQKGTIWEYTFDARGNVLTERQVPQTQKWFYTYDANDNLKTFSAPSEASFKTTLNYDIANNLTTVVDYLNRTQVTNAYGPYGLLQSSTDTVGNATSYANDSHGNLNSTTYQGGTSSAVYDLLGRPTSVTDPLTNSTAVEYDEWGRRVRVIHPGSSDANFSFDDESNLTSVQDERDFTNSFVYDDAGRATNAINARGDQEIYYYDANGRRWKVRNGRGFDRIYSFNTRSQVWKLAMPDGTTEYWSYDGRGDLGRFTNGLGQPINYTNGVYGPTRVDYPAGYDTTFAYDYAGRMVEMRDVHGFTTWNYDGVGDLTLFGSPQNAVSYQYDAAGRRTWMQNYSPSTGYEATTFAYDDANRKVTITNQFSEVFVLTRDVAQRLSRKDFASGVYETYTYDNRSRPTSIVVKNSSAATIAGQAYTYDPASNVATHTQDAVVTTYGYDPIGQLTSESRTGYSGAYTYDANGNRLTRAVNGLTETYACDSGDKLTSVTWPGGSKTYGHDACGRTTSITSGIGTTTLAYDLENRITTIQHGGGGSSSNTYSGLNTRISRVDKWSQNYTFHRDGGGVTDPLLFDGQTKYTPDSASRQGSVTTFRHHGIKSYSIQSNASSAVTATRTYDAFGSVASSSGTWASSSGHGGPFGYQENSDSGLHLLGNRYYDPSTGRFLTKYPIREGRNNYVYASNNPVSRADPTGLFIVPYVGQQGWTGDFERSGGQGYAAGIIAQAEGESNVGPEDCGIWVRGIYGRLRVAMPPGAANTWADWFRGSGDWVEVDNDGNSLEPGDVIVISRPRRRHGHIMIVGVDGEIYNASLNEYRPRLAAGHDPSVPIADTRGGNVTIWRHRPIKRVKVPGLPVWLPIPRRRI